MKNWFILFISFIAVVIVNILSNTLPINGKTASEISNQIDVLFTPAGYVFSIWSLIYFLLAVWLFIQWKHVKNGEKLSPKLTLLFTLSCLLNISWLFSFHYEQFILSTIIMLLLLLTLISLYLLYPKGDRRFGGRLPFSIYLGWISVATIANISFTLKYYGVSLGIDEVSGTIVLLVIAGLLALIGRVRSDDYLFALVFVWAIVGVAQSNVEKNLITAAYLIAIVIFLFTVGYPFFKKRS